MAGGPPPLGPYPYHEVLSALRKDIKLNRLDDAVYWALLIIDKSAHNGQKSLAKQLWIMAAEDIDDPDVVVRAFICYQMAGQVPETDHLLYLVGQMCRARKWWEHEDGRAVDEAWARAEGDFKRGFPREIPHYALDRHTRRGWTVKAEEGWFDDRFSGTELGRAKTRYMFLRDGFLDPESRVECTRDGEVDDGFWAYWQERRRVMAMDQPERVEEAPPAEESDPQETLFEE